MTQTLLPFRISRSELENFFSCPYSGYLSSLTPGPQRGSPIGLTPAGIQRRERPSSLVIGGAIHKGWEMLLRRAASSEAAEDQAVEHALQHVREQALAHDHSGQSLSDFELREALAMVEGLVRISARQIMPILANLYEVVDVEPELSAPLAHGYSGEFAGAAGPVRLDIPSIEFAGRPDAVLRRREDGQVGSLSLKTSKYIEVPGELSKTGRKIVDQQAIDMQSLSESWLLRGAGYDPSFIQFVTLRKGDVRQHETKEMERAGVPGFPYYNLPLLTGWKKEDGLGQAQYAWAWDFYKEEDGFRKKSTLSWTAWKRFWVFDEPGLSIREWLGMLERDEVFPPQHQSINGRSALDNLFQVSLPIFRTDRQVELWRVQSTAQARRIADAWSLIKEEDPDSDDGLLHILEQFPRNTRSCVFPSRCQFFEHCHEGTPTRDPGMPVDMLFYQPRQENHPRAEQSKS